MDLKNIDPKNVNVIVGGRFRLKELLGKGTFGQIYSAVVNGTESEVAVKLEKRQPGAYFGLSKEARIISELHGKTGFPNLFAFGKEDSFDYMTITLLGSNLGKYHKLCGNKFPMKTTLMIADQILTRIEALHNLGYVHRDIKPENFLMGLGASEKNVFLIDFGLAHRYLDPQGRHVGFKEKRGLIGTARYASINSHAGCELSRRDDLESIAYMLIYFVKGKLPWQNMKAATVQEKYQKIGELKMNTPIDILCKDIPKEFGTFLTAVRELSYDETPNYKALRKIFRMLFLESGFDFDYNYGWDRGKTSSGTKKSKTSKFKLESGTPKNSKETPTRGKERVGTYVKPNKYMAVFNQMDEVVEEEKIEESYLHPEKPESVSKEHGENEDLSSKADRQSGKNPSNKHSTKVRMPDESESSSQTSKDMSIKVNNNVVDEEIPIEIDIYASPAERISETQNKHKGMISSPRTFGLSQNNPSDRSHQGLETLRMRTSGFATRRVLIDETTVKKELLERSKSLKAPNHNSPRAEDYDCGDANDEWAGQSNLASILHSKKSVV